MSSSGYDVARKAVWEGLLKVEQLVRYYGYSVETLLGRSRRGAVWSSFLGLMSTLAYVGGVLFPLLPLVTIPSVIADSLLYAAAIFAASAAFVSVKLVSQSTDDRIVGDLLRRNQLTEVQSKWNLLWLRVEAGEADDISGIIQRCDQLTREVSAITMSARHETHKSLWKWTQAEVLAGWDVGLPPLHWWQYHKRIRRAISTRRAERAKALKS